MDKRTRLIASPNIASAIWRLALPAIISMAVMAVYNMADTYFVSLVSDQDLEVAAVSVYLPVLLITQSVSVLFAAGGAAYLSRQLGEKDSSGADRTATTTILLSFISGAVILVLGLIFCEPILIAFGASSATLGMAKDYAVVMFIAAPIQLTNMSFNNLLRAEGNAVRSMTGMVTGAALNIALDPIFISGAGMGVMGAAVATAIAQVVAFLILGSAYWRRRTTAKVRLKDFRFQSRTVWYIVRVGMSTFLIQIFTAVGIAVMNVYAYPYGDGPIAALGIANRLQYLGFAILFGFSQGFQPVCGYNFGAHEFDRLRRTLLFGIVVAVLLGLGITLMFRFSARPLVRLFANEQSVIATGVEVLEWFTVAFPLTAFSLIMMMTYQSLGRSVGATVIAVCRQGVCMIPLIMTLTQVIGFQGILISPMLSDIISGVISAFLAARILKYIRSERDAHETLRA